MKRMTVVTMALAGLAFAAVANADPVTRELVFQPVGNKLTVPVSNVVREAPYALTGSLERDRRDNAGECALEARPIGNKMSVELKTC